MRSTHEQPLPVLVVGAGPVGLATAIGLARRGVPVHVVERLPEPSRRSKALLVWPRALQALRELTGSDAIASAGLPMESFHYYSSTRHVARLGFVDRTRPVVLPQPDVEAHLHEAARRTGVVLRRRAALTGLQQHDDRVSVTLTAPDGHSRADYAYVVGCDGAKSTVRELLGLAFDGLTYPNAFLLADVQVDGAPRHDAVHYYCSRAGVLVLIGLPGGRYRVFTSAPAGFAAEATDDDTLAALQTMVDARGPGGLRLHDPAWTSVFLVQARHVDRYRAGRVLLAGDAAHVHSPAGGQGLNTGVTDAHNLAWKLAAVWLGDAGDQLLDTYGAERLQVARSVVRQADLQTRAWLLRNRVAVLARDVSAALAARLGAFDPWYVPWLAGLTVRYRSGAVAGRGARFGASRPFAPGALVPDTAVTTPGTSGAVPLREALSSTEHTLLVLPGRARAAAAAGPAGTGPVGTASAADRSARVEVRRFDPDAASLGPVSAEAAATDAPVVLVRPDGHVAAIGRGPDAAQIAAYLDAYLTAPAGPASDTTGSGTTAGAPAGTRVAS